MAILGPGANTRAGGDGETGHSRVCNMIDYLADVVGGARGWLCMGFGVGPWFRTTSGRIKPSRWVQTAMPWPDAADEVLAFLLEHSREADCYLCPHVMSGHERTKGTSVAPMTAHADVDGGRLDLVKVAAIPGACAVGSGSPGNGHVYVLLTRPLPPHQHEQLCRGLAAYLGAKDPKISDNDVLRVPGTWNHKPTVDKLPPNPVTWLIRPDGERTDPVELARLLGVELTDAPPPFKPKPKSQSKSGGDAAALLFEVSPFDLARSPMIRRALAKVTVDRSGDTMRVVAACARAGLTEGHARWAVLQREDLAWRLDERHDDDVARCWERVTDSRQERNVLRRFRRGWR